MLRESDLFMSSTMADTLMSRRCASCGSPVRGRPRRGPGASGWSTTTVYAAAESEASHHVDADEQRRESLTCLPDPHTDLHQDRQHQDEQPAPRLQAQRPGGDREEQHEGGQDVAGPRVHVGEHGRVEAVPQHIRRRRNGDPTRSSARRRRSSRASARPVTWVTAANHAEPRAHGVRRPSSGAPGRRRDADEQQGRGVVEAHDEGVEAGQHRDAAGRAPGRPRR